MQVRRGGIPTRLAAVLLLIGMASVRSSRADARQPGSIPSYGAVLAGSITWTLHGSESQTISSGGETHTHTYQVDASTTFVFVAGLTVAQRSSISLVNDDRWTCSASCSDNREIRETLKGSYSGPAHDSVGNDLVDAAPGEQNADGTLQVRPQLTEGIIPATGTYTDSGRPSGNSTFQLRAQYPDRDSWYPGSFPTYAALGTGQGSPRLSGSATQHLADTIVVGVPVVLEGQETVTWRLVVVYWNGKQIAPVPSNPVTPGASPTAQRARPASCGAQSGPGYAAPVPPPFDDAGSAAAAPAQPPAAGKKMPATAATPTIPWRSTPQLSWADFKKNPPATTPWGAETSSGVGGGFSHGGYKSCADPATGLLKTTVQYTLAGADALFYPSGSWVLPKYARDSSSAASADLLNHEQRHFDISEAYSRKLHDQLLALLNGSMSHTFTCVQWAGCVGQVNQLDGQLKQALTQAEASLSQTQADYDRETDHSRNTAQQQAWNSKIDAWLAAPASAP